MSSDSTIPHPSPSVALKPVKPVTERTLIRRINRALAKEGKVLRLCRIDSQWLSTLGRYYQEDIDTNMAGAWFTTLGELITYAKETGVLAEHEYIA